MPELSNEWLSHEEIQARVPKPNVGQHYPMDREETAQASSGSAQRPIPVADDDDDGKGPLQEGELPSSEERELPRSEERELPRSKGRTRSAPNRYSDAKQNLRPQSGGSSHGFDKRIGKLRGEYDRLKGGGQYAISVAKATSTRIYKAVRLSRPTHMGYVYALLTDPEYGIMHDLLPNLISRPGLLKAAKNDPDSPSLDQAMMGPH